MRNIRIEIEYDGTHYCGWQVQNRHRGKKSVQEVLEKALRKILNEKVQTIVSGRTDAGVHALAQVANFKTKSGIRLEKLKFAINGLLPEDIAVCGIEEAAPGFHSRFDAKSKIYRYTILNRSYPSALASGKVYFCPFPLNVERMRQETKALIGRHDFKAFQAADKRERGSVKTIKKIKFTLEGSFIHIDIEADGFLYNMARNIIGTLVEIGRGRFLKGSLRKILLSRSRSLAGPTAPAKGLCLIKVKY